MPIEQAKADVVAERTHRSRRPRSLSSMRGLSLAYVVTLLLAALSVYGERLSGPFIFDDVQSVVDNDTLQGFRSALQPPRETPVAGRPLANLTLALDYALHGPSPEAFHATNLLLHIACVLLAFLTLRQLLAAIPAASPLSWPSWLQEHASEHAFLACLAFCVHPMTLELVLYVSQRTETLAGALYLAATLLLTAAGQCGGRSWVVALLFALIGVLGVCAKEVFVTAPVVLLCCDRAFYAGSLRAALHKRGLYYAALALCWIPAGLLQLHGPRSDSVHLWSLDYVLTQARIVPGYFEHALWPLQLPTLDYGQLWPQRIAQGWPWLVLSSAGVITFTALAWRTPRSGFVFCWALLILAPSSSLLSIHTEIGAERRFYLPLLGVLAGVCIALSALLWRALRQKSVQLQVLGQRAAFAAGLVVCALLSLQTRSYAEDFHSLRAFWTAAVRGRPENARAHYNLAETLRREGDVPGAIASFRAALQAQESYADAHSNLAGLLMATGALAEGLAHAERGVDLALSSPTAHYNLALACALNGQLERAVTELEVTLRLQPDHWAARRKLAQAYVTLGRPRAARDHARLLLAHAPDDTVATRVLAEISATEHAKPK
jgi:tetratricopeptide (TPR) repeat protein